MSGCTLPGRKKQKLLLSVVLFTVVYLLLSTMELKPVVVIKYRDLYEFSAVYMSKMSWYQLPASSHQKTNIKRVIIVAYHRSGSTFLGELLNSRPDTYYSFEPLHQFSVSERLTAEQVPRALQIMSDVMSCNFSNSTDYLEDLRNWNYSVRENRFLWSRCYGALNVCVDPQFITAACRNASFWVMKLTRANVSHVHELMKADQELADTVKVVHLVRDPRGILNSRKRVHWCNATCRSVQTLCEQMRGDLDAFDDLERDFPDSVLRVKYEDFVQNLPTSAEELFSLLRENFTDDVRSFIANRTSGLTKEDLWNKHSTKRNPSSSATQWREKLEVPDIVSAQEACFDVILRLGYQMVEDPQKERNRDLIRRRYPHFVDPERARDPYLRRRLGFPVVGDSEEEMDLYLRHRMGFPIVGDSEEERDLYLRRRMGFPIVGDSEEERDLYLRRRIREEERQLYLRRLGYPMYEDPERLRYLDFLRRRDMLMRHRRFGNAFP